MATTRVGLITIGQSPRDDVVPDMLAQINADVETVERGALDGLTLEQVRELAPQGDEPWFVSRMRDGTEVMLARRELIPRMQACVDELTELGVDLIVPLCSADWSVLDSRVPFINPGRALAVINEALVRPGGRLGVVMPTEAQAQIAQARYERAGEAVVTTFAQPYTSVDEQLEQCRQAGELLAREQVDLIYMGCMGHTQKMRSIVRQASGLPTVTANGMIAALLSQMLAS